MARYTFEENDAFVSGREMRREVLGAAYADRTTQVGADDDFMGPLRQLSAEFVWAKVWSRPGLDVKTRRPINIALLAAVNRQHEVTTHVRAATEVGGVSKEEIREVLIHVMAYCGIPAAVDAFRTAKEYFDSVEGDGSGPAS